MKLFLFLIIISLVSCTYHPVLQIAKPFQEIKKENYIIPYFMNLIALLNIRNDQNIDDVENYIYWVFSNLNYPDKHGLTGTIYDFSISKKGVEKKLNQYDSVDSYSATFIRVLYEYSVLTNNMELIEANKEKIKDIAYTIAYLVDSDGLTVAIPNTKEKYLMDNCEVYSGIKAYIEIAKIRNWNNVDYYERILKKLKSSILENFYNEENLNFNWAIDDTRIHSTNWDTFYPDSYAQLFPILFGLLEENQALKMKLWNTYFRIYGERELPFEQEIVFQLTKKRMSL